MCPECKGHSGAHYGWCVLVGGPGYHPSSFHGIIDKTKRAVAERARLEAERQAEEDRRRRSTNGWVRRPRELAPEAPEWDGVIPELPAIETSRRRKPRRVLNPGAVRPGKEIGSKEVRALLNVAVDHGWRYVPSATHPYVVSPDGRYRVGGSSSPSDHNAHRTVARALRKAGLSVVA